MQNRKANTAAVLRENLMSVESSPILSVRSNQHLPGDDISCDVIEPVWWLHRNFTLNELLSMSCRLVTTLGGCYYLLKEALYIDTHGFLWFLLSVLFANYCTKYALGSFIGLFIRTGQYPNGVFHWVVLQCANIVLSFLFPSFKYLQTPTTVLYLVLFGTALFTFWRLPSSVYGSRNLLRLRRIRLHSLQTLCTWWNVYLSRQHICPYSQIS